MYLVLLHTIYSCHSYINILELHRYLYNDDVTAVPVCDQYEIPITYGFNTDERPSVDDTKEGADDDKASTQDELREESTTPLIAESGAYITLL